MSRESDYLENAIDRYPPAIAATARAALRRLRTRFPGAHLLVYDRRQSLPIGLAPAVGGGAPISVVLYPRWVRFFFLEGAALDDPKRLRTGTSDSTHAVTFMFPGQGSQKVGMGKDLADAFAPARLVFQEVDDALSQKLSRIMWEGPEADLTLTENAQPAIMAASAMFTSRTDLPK